MLTIVLSRICSLDVDMNIANKIKLLLLLNESFLNKYSYIFYALFYLFCKGTSNIAIVNYVSIFEASYWSKMTVKTLTG
jgi:hypothetical protein